MAKSKKKAAASKSTQPAKAAAAGVPSKSAFIRQHPGKKPAEIVELALKAGLSFKPEYVYTIRQADKKTSGKSSKSSKGNNKGTKSHKAAGKTSHASKTKSKSQQGVVWRIGHAANEYGHALKDLVLTHGIEGAKHKLEEIVRDLRGSK